MAKKPKTKTARKVEAGRKRAAKSAKQRIREIAAVAASAEVPEFVPNMPAIEPRGEFPVRELEVRECPTREL